MENTNDMLGKRLKEVCQEKGISYRELAEKVDMPTSRIFRIANGMTTNPGIYTMIRICKGLEISLDEFFSDEAFHQ